MTETITLSSNPSSTYVGNTLVYLSDILDITLKLDNIDLTRPPVSLKIDWGDGSDRETYYNDFFTQNINTVNEILYGYNYTLITDYNHSYTTATNASTKNLSCQALVTYYNGTSCVFVQPISIISPSFHSKIGDITLLNNNILEDKSILYTFHASIDKQIVESLYSPSNS